MTAHDEGYERAITTWLARTADHARMLGAQHVELAAHVAATGGGPGDVTGIRGSKTSQPLPIRAEVVDLRADIAAAARKYSDLTRGTLRMGDVAFTRADPQRRLRFIAGGLSRLHAADPAVAEEVADAIYDLYRRAAAVIDPSGRQRRPFRIDDPCPNCDRLSLWFDPARWLIACGMPGCRAVYGIAAPVLRHSVGG